MRNKPLKGFANKPMQTVGEQTGKISGRLDELKPDLSNWEKSKQIQRQKQIESINKLKNRGNGLNLDEVQRNLNYAGITPGVGIVPDIANVAISGIRSISSLLKGDTGKAKSHALYGGISLGAAIPGPVGQMIGSTKIIPTLTRKGIKNIPADKFKGTTYFRAEDAYIGQPGSKISEAFGKTGKETHNWFTKRISHIKDTYLPNVKDAALQGRSKTHTFYLPKGALKRGMTVNLSPGMSQRFSRSLQTEGTTANIMSGGVGKLIQPGEIVIPTSITKKIRKGTVPYASVFHGRSSEEMMRQFTKKTLNIPK